MSSEKLSEEERKELLRIARKALTDAVNGFPGKRPDPTKYTQALSEDGATFVTLTIDSKLRGCIGTLEAYQPLVVDVYEHAIAAGLQDYRFPPVQPNELPLIKIEISRLTKPQKLEYTTSEELIQKLRQGVDGVILSYGHYRATFLPQVWEKLPNPEEFLSQLSMKMGLSHNAWKEVPMDVSIYQVEEFSEPENHHD